MKNTFLPQQLLKLSLILSNALCHQPSALFGQEGIGWPESRLTTLTRSNSAATKADISKSIQNGLKDDNHSLKWLNDDSSQQPKHPKGSHSPTPYTTPGTLFFPLEEQSVPPNAPDNLSYSNKTSNSPYEFAQRQAIDKDPIAQNEPAPSQPANGATQLSENATNPDGTPQTVLINFNNIAIIEYIRFVSRIINKNFVFDENELQFNVTIISEEPTTLDNVMTALLQELRIHDLTLLEQGNNLIIHRNPKVNAISQVVSDDATRLSPNSEIITQVFRLNTASPEQVASVIKPLTSEFALVEVLAGTNHIIITDLSANIMQIAKLIKSVDSPASGLVIGQYVVRLTSPDVLIEMVRKIISPLSQDQPLTFVSWEPSSSIFVVSTPFIVERTLSILQHIDQNEKSTKIFDFKDMHYDESKDKNLSPAGLYLNSEPYEPSLEEQLRLGAPTQGGLYPANQWQRTPDGKWNYSLGKDANGNWIAPAGYGSSNVVAPIKPGEYAPPINGVYPVGRDANGNLVYPDVVKDANGNLLPSLRDANGNVVPFLKDASGNVIPFQKDAHGNLIPLQRDANGDLVPIKAGQQKGAWRLDKDGNWYYDPNATPEEGGAQPAGHWVYDPATGWRYVLDDGEAPSIQRVFRADQEVAPIPLAAKQQSFFTTYKLKYRQGSSIQQALQSIANSLAGGEPGNEDLVATLISVQWLEASNSLIFTGYKDILRKVTDLMNLIDVPLRQVFIEMLILEATVDDSLEYGVTWGTRFGGGNWAGAQGFQTTLSPLQQSLNLTGFGQGLSPVVPNTLINQDGLSMGIIGQRLVNTALGIEYSSIGALLHALRTKSNTNVISSPKIVTEDNVAAEIFVGENVPFKTQSLANDNSNTITNNFEYRDVGTRLRVTPTIGSNNIISIEIAQEVSRLILSTVPTGQNANNAPGPSTTKSTTTTRVHLPDGYFLIISGLMSDEYDRIAEQVPCLGAIPVLGSAFKDKSYNDTKRNQMIFLRPKIIDTEEEIQNLTKHEQDIWEFKSRHKKDWIYETGECFEWMNLKRDIVTADPDIADKDS